MTTAFKGLILKDSTNSNDNMQSTVTHQKYPDHFPFPVSQFTTAIVLWLHVMLTPFVECQGPQPQI